MDYMDMEFQEEPIGSVTEDTWEQEEETLSAEEEEIAVNYEDLPGETGPEEWIADADTDASDASDPGENRMRSIGGSPSRTEEDSRWGGNFAGFGKCACGCRSYVGPGRFCKACGHSYDAHAR
ncbi:MAG: hypothetical protein LIP08_10675 [Bacteroides sp.]|nr:hypothetical protein [Bacteroides sp.]